MLAWMQYVDWYKRKNKNVLKPRLPSIITRA